MPSGFVYICASKRNGTLYIGVTCDIPRRVQAHREGRGSKFVAKYGVTRLVWFEEHPLYAHAIKRDGYGVAASPIGQALDMVR